MYHVGVCMYEITPVGQGFLWMGTYSMLFFSGIYIKSIFRIEQKTRINYAYRLLLVAIAVITFLCHIATTSIFLTDLRHTIVFDIHHIEYVIWILTTPLFIILVCLLEKCRPLYTTMLVLADIGMIASGYAAQFSTSDTQFWTLFIFSGCLWSGIVFTLIRKTYFFYYDGLAIKMLYINHTLLSFLVGCIVVSWNVYPIIVILRRNELIDLSTEFILYSIFDLLNKGIYGLLFLGAKEVEEKIQSRLANYTLGLASVLPFQSRYTQHTNPEAEVANHNHDTIVNITVQENTAVSQKIEP